MPKSKEQFQEMKDTRRESIILAAMYQFALKGYSAVRIDDITKPAKCSHGLIYHYFHTKEDCFYAVMEMIKTKLDDRHDKLDMNRPAKDIIEDIIKAILSDLNSEDSEYACMYYLLLNLHLQRKDIPPKKDNKPHKKFVELFIDLIERGQNEGDFIKESPKEIAISVIALITSLAYNRIRIDKDRFICPNENIVMNLLLKRR